MNRTGLLILLLFTFGLMSCETDFEINAYPGEDITVVFGLLDQTDTVHYIKITRAFLGENDALIMAQDPSLSDYGDILDVKVEEYSNSNLTATFQCVRTKIIDKETGTFYYPEQYIYAFTADLHTESIYKLIIKNNETGKEVTAETGLVGDFSVEKPYYNPANPQLSFVTSNWQYASSEAKWESAKNGRLYEPLFRFNYREVDIPSSDTVDKHVDWTLSAVKSTLLSGGEPMLSPYNAESFYAYLEAVIPVDYNKIRLIGNINFMLSVGGDELSTYIDLNAPSTSIIQERPAYTNVSNGIGIFSCRRTKTLTYNFNSYSIDKLANGEYTSQLGFQ
jgi:hypothetical protein